MVAFCESVCENKGNEKRIHQKMEELGGVTESQATMEQKVTVDQWNDPKFLSQEINKELYDLNVTNEEIKVSPTKNTNLPTVGLGNYRSPTVLHCTQVACR